MATFGYILAALFMLGVLIMFHELGHYLAARWLGIEVKEFAIGMGPKIFSRKGKQGTLFSLRALPVGGFCLYYGEDQEAEEPRAYNNQPVWKRFLSVLAGPLMNFLLALVLAVMFFMVWGVETPVPVIGRVDEGTPAIEAGLLPGDTILAIDGVPITQIAEATALVRASEGAPLQIAVGRGEEELTFSVTPRFNEQEERYQIGIYYATVPDLTPLPLGQAISTSVVFCQRVVAVTYQALADLIFRGEGTDGLSGFVGIVNVIQQETRAGGLPVYFQLAILISINLAFMNLLPVPGLDGSRLIFNIVEAIRRKPLNRNVEGMIHFFGVVALLGIMLLFTYNDILHIFGVR
ncbi:MAG: site-2 protease family protein [Clostridia bacterium]|nr:site-2 protease family protein [Clostridia bacterium]